MSGIRKEPSNRTLDIEESDEDTDGGEVSVETGKEANSVSEEQDVLRRIRTPGPGLNASLKRLTDANGVPLRTLARRRANKFKLSANLDQGRLRKRKGSTSASFMGLMSDNYKNSLSVSKRGRLRKNINEPGRLRKKQPSYESGTKFNLAQMLRGSSERLGRSKLKKAGDIKLMLPNKPQGGPRIESIQRQKFVPKNRALKTVRERRNQQNFQSGSRMMNDFGDASNGTVEVEEDDEEESHGRGSFVPKSEAITKLQKNKLSKLGQVPSGKDKSQVTMMSEETDEEEEEPQAPQKPFVPQNSLIKGLQAKRDDETLNQKLSRAPKENQITENTLFSDEETVLTEKSDPFLKSGKTSAPGKLKNKSSRVGPIRLASSRRVRQLSPEQQAAKESFRLSVAHFVNQTSDRRSVSFMNSHRSVLRGPSVRLSMAGANNAQDIVREIQDRQRQQDEILSKLYRSRKFRQAERSRRGQGDLSSNIRASMRVSVQPIIQTTAEPEVEQPKHNRAEQYKEHGMLGFFSLSALGKGCDRVIDLTEMVPLDLKVVVTVTGIASAAAYVIFLFTADYSVDTLGLE